tara:strand:- start:389 stop:907 length:519 start_codon:yes stop_codon:yes gene_type:complete
MREFNIDWSKSHNGLMLCTLDQAEKLMPEVVPILKELDVEMDWKDYLIDVKVHMLMPNQFPCIPNFHYDFLPRDEKGNRSDNARSDKKMYMWLSDAPLTLYKGRDGAEFTKPAQQWHSFTQHDLHRGQMSESHVWRCFIRVIPKCFLHKKTKNIGEVRRHIQVYCDSSKFRW